MAQPPTPRHFLGFFPPYRTLEHLRHPAEIPQGPEPPRGSALLWFPGPDPDPAAEEAVRSRPPGIALLLFLPPTRQWISPDAMLHLMQSCRPHTVLPAAEGMHVSELTAVLRRFPTEFALEVTEYLLWRGLHMELDTRRLLRRVFELSEELRTVTGLARALYLSRRALGRRFLIRGLPVPSHWLHFGRVLRAALLLQRPGADLASVAHELGYPDGFSLSNQMLRLTGVRPSTMSHCLGWEWIVEAWLRREARAGAFSPPVKRQLFPDLSAPASSGSEEPAKAKPQGDPTKALRVAEGESQRPEEEALRAASKR